MEDVGDLYLDVAEAYMDQRCFVDAKPILKKLVNSENYNLVFLTVLLKKIYVNCINKSVAKVTISFINTAKLEIHLCKASQSKVSNLIFRSV